MLTDHTRGRSATAHARKSKAANRVIQFAAVCAFAISLLSMSVLAQADESSRQPMRFDRISLDEGLSQSNVFSILQDSKGLLWVGTEAGLNRYDGYGFRTFRRKRGNPNALLNDYVFDIAEDEGGALWIATNGGGLARLNRDGETFTSFRHDPDDSRSISSNVVRTLLPDADGTIWLGTRGAGVDHFDPEKGVIATYRFQTSDAPARDTNEVYALHRSTDGMLWVGTNDGLVRLNPASGEFAHFRPKAGDTGSISDHRVRAIYEDSRGQLWIGTYAGGLNRFNYRDGTFTRYRHDDSKAGSIAADRVTSIFEDSTGRLWVGTYKGLNLYISKSDSFVRYANDSRDPYSLGDDIVTTLFEDRSGVLWVGTRNGGLSKWNPRSWSLGLKDATALTASGAEQPNVTSFVEDADGTLWIGTLGDGLHAVDRDKDSTRTYRHEPGNPNSISDNRVMSLAQDSKGYIWAGTMTGGLNRLDPETGRVSVFRHDAEDAASLSANGVMAIFEDSAGYLWVGTYGGGANRFDPESGRFTRFLPSEKAGSISSDRVRSFAEDHTGRIWMGTDGGGLNLFDPETESFHHFRHDPFDAETLADDTIYALRIDASGTLWIGTQGGGVDRVLGSARNPDSIRFANVSHADGLANDVIYGLEIDDSGELWVSTNHGISRYNPKTGDVRNLHRKDGLQSEEFNSGAHYKSTSGELFFGGPYGYNAFLPDRIEMSKVIPPIVMTAWFKGNDPVKADEPIDEETGIDISWKDDVVTFEFAALDFTASAQNRYRYKLQGFDREWIELGTNRRITYTDLDDGKYLLRVQASNSDGIWNEAGYNLPVRVSPAPWDTWWAYLGYFAVALQLAAYLWLGHRRKVQREEEYSNRLEEEVRERTERLVESNKKLNELNRTLQESSLSDPLTGLRNRRFVFEEVSRDLDVIRRRLIDEDHGIDPNDAADLVFMMIDLDNFKPINDTYGHAAGDQMLLEVRDVLLGTCRKSDFVVRWGGDEFVVIAKQAKPGESEALAERIRSKIAEHNFMLDDGQIVRTTCSIGFAAFPLFRGQADDADLDHVLSLADNLMYEAKRHRNAWAGMLAPSVASTSADFDLDSIEPTSMLFRAKRSGQLYVHGIEADEFGSPIPVSSAGQGRA